jgi:hypothetical protein
MNDNQRKAMFAKLNTEQGSRQSKKNPFYVQSPTGKVDISDSYYLDKDSLKINMRLAGYLTNTKSNDLKLTDMKRFAKDVYNVQITARTKNDAFAELVDKVNAKSNYLKQQKRGW